MGDKMVENRMTKWWEMGDKMGKMNSHSDR